MAHRIGGVLVYDSADGAAFEWTTGTLDWRFSRGSGLSVKSAGQSDMWMEITEVRSDAGLESAVRCSLDIESESEGAATQVKGPTSAPAAGAADGCVYLESAKAAEERLAGNLLRVVSCLRGVVAAQREAADVLEAKVASATELLRALEGGQGHDGRPCP
jgi:hypothetical protein